MPLNLSRRGFIAVTAAGVASGQALADAPALRSRFAFLYAGAAKEGRVVYYGNTRTEETRALSLFWRSNFPDVQLTILPRSAPQLVTQVEAEKSAGVVNADVVSLAVLPVAVQWRRQGWLAPF
jgi:iron(III) transport system substrate-binding protein